MKDKNDILIQIFRKRLKDYEQPVRRELWASIEKDMKASTPMSSRKILWRYAGIAASFLLILGLGTLYYFDHRMKGDQLVDSQTKTDLPEMQKKEAVTEELKPIGNNEPIREQKALVINTIVHAEAEPIIETPVPLEDIKITPESKEEKPPVDQHVSDKKENSGTKKSQSIDNHNLWNYPQRKKSKNEGISYALAVGNSGKNLDFSPGDMDGERTLYNFADESKSQGYLSAPVGYADLFSPPPPPDYRFNLPISAGFTVRKHFSDALALESGLIYTYLSSEEKINEHLSPTTKDVQLHYLGIPLKLVYSFYNRDRLSIYISGGGMAEKFVYGKVKTNKGGAVTIDQLNIPEMQWSVSGSVGVNYRLVDHLGLFIEPGIGYYFDDGSDVMTVRKDTPFNFMLQGGIRLTY